MGKNTKRSVALVAGSILAVAGGTAAFAYASGWFRGGGTVTATASTIQDIRVAVALPNTPQSRLFPGKTVELPPVRVNNTNDYPVSIKSIRIASLATTPAGSGCGVDQADLSFGAVPDNTTLDAGENKVISLGTISMAETADPACSGVGITVNATLSGEIASGSTGSGPGAAPTK